MAIALILSSFSEGGVSYAPGQLADLPTSIVTYRKAAGHVDDAAAAISDASASGAAIRVHSYELQSLVPILPSPQILRRLPHVVAALGDSRIDAIYLDASTRRNLGARSPLNWANALMGHRLVIGDDYGVSGDRTDQMLARLAAAIASGAGLLYLQGGVNDIAQNYPTAGTSGATAFANLKAMAEAGRAAGMQVVIEAEVGAQNLNTAAFVTQINELNALLYEYAEETPGVHVHDARSVVLNATSSDTVVSFKAGYTSDGTHPTPKGAAYWGESLAALLTQIIPSRAQLLGRNRIELPSNGRRQLLLNHLFQTATGGTLSNGVTGTVPSGWTGHRATTVPSAAFSTQADASGLGNNVVIDATFTAAGEEIRLYQDVNIANWLPGDIVEVYADVQIVGNPTCLASVALYLGHNTGSGGTTYDSFDLLHGVTSEAGPDHAMSLPLKTRPYVLNPTVGAGPFLTARARIYSSGAGTAQIIVKQMGVRRRTSFY